MLMPQLLKSGTSIGANLEEADAAQSRADFVNKCQIALKEARETLYWLRVFEACSPRPIPGMPPLLNEANQLVAILTTIVKNTKAGAP